MAFTAQNRADAYLFFVLALKAAPGSVHGAEIARAYDSGVTTEEIVAILVEKPAFLSLFPANQTPAQFAQTLVSQVADDSTSQAVRLAAIADIENALTGGLTKAQVITQIMANLQSKSVNDANWGTAIARLEEKIAIAKDKTEGPNAISNTDWESLAKPLLETTAPKPEPEPQPTVPATIAVSAGGTFNGTAGRVDHFKSTIPDLNGSTIAGNAADKDTLTLTTAGTVTLNNGTTGGTVSGIKVLNLANGINDITYDISGGITTINGGEGVDTINLLLNDDSATAVAFAPTGISGSGIEKVNIRNNDNHVLPSGLFKNSLTWLGSSVKSINVSGNAGLHLTAESTTLTEVDASGITLGGFTWTSGALTGQVTVRGSATGPNTVNLSAATVGVDYVGGSVHDNVTINANAENSVNMGDGTNMLAINGIPILGTFTGGSGSDTLTLLFSLADISDATITGFEHLTVAENSTIKANVNQLAQFTGNITAGGTETITLMTAGTFGAIDNIEKYNLANGTNIFTASDSTTHVFGGTGNDTLNFTADQIANPSFKLVDGGLGSDVLNIGIWTTQTINLSGKASGIETINVEGGAGAADFTNLDGAGVTLNYTKSNGDHTIILGDGGQTLNIFDENSSQTITYIQGGAGADEIFLDSNSIGSNLLIVNDLNKSNVLKIDKVYNFDTSKDKFKTGFNFIGELGVFSTTGDPYNVINDFIYYGGSILNNKNVVNLIYYYKNGVDRKFLFQNTGSDVSRHDKDDFFVELVGLKGSISSDLFIE